MNTKKEQLLFLEISVDDDQLGRILIEPARNSLSSSFVNYFLNCKHNKKPNGDCLATVCEVKPHAHVKFEWTPLPQTDLENNRNVCVDGETSLDNAAHCNSNSDDLSFYSDLLSGVVIVNESSLQFSVLTTRWSPTEIGGTVVGRVFKGSSLMAHLSSMDTNGSGKPTKLCKVIDAGVIAPDTSLGLKKRDALLDHYPTLPQDANTVDFMDIDRVLTVGYTIKASGSLLFRQEKFQMAMVRFNKAVRYLTHVGEKQKLTREQEVRLLTLVVPCILNSAACKIKCKDFDGALEDCNEALEINPGNAKIFFRRGQAHHGKMNYEQSLFDLYTALKLAPNDKSIKNEIAAVEGEMQVYKKRKGSKK